MARTPRTPGRRAEHQLDAELRFHLEQRVADLVDAGLPIETAQAQARREFGGVEQVKEACRDERPLRWVSDGWRDIVVASRALLRAPVFTVVAILTLTLGIGANVAVFQVLDALTLRALPVPEADRLRQIVVNHRGEGRSGNFRGRLADLTAAQVDVLQRELTELDGLAVWANLAFNLADTGEMQLAEGLRVNGDYFRVLGVTPLRGRLLGPADDVVGCGTGAAVVSEGFWRRSLGGREDVVGRELRLDGHTFEIVGVWPASFFGVEVGRAVDVAVPLCTERVMTIGPSMLDSKRNWWLAAVTRLPAGMTDAQFSARLEALAPALFRETLPEEYRPELAERYLAFTFDVQPAGAGVSPLRTRFTSPLYLLVAITAIVLLIACANLANLLLARASHRERELAVRLAIGSSRARLVRYSAAEAVVLTAVGTAAGVGVAVVLSHALVQALSSRTSPVYLDLEMNWALLAFTASVAAVTALLCAVGPAIRSSHVPPAQALRHGLRTSASGAALSWRRLLIVSQVALTFVLLVGALLFARSLANLRAVDVGFEPEGLVTASLRLDRLPDWQARRPAIATALRERLESVSWVRGVSEVAYVPIGGSSWNDTIEVSGLDRTDVQSQLNRVGPAFLSTVGIALREGRFFTETDRVDSPLVAVVNETFRDRYLSGAQALGRTVRFLSEPDITYEVVGVVARMKYASVKEDDPPIIFVADAQQADPPPLLQLAIRSTLPPEATAAAIGAVVGDVAPQLNFQTRAVSTLINDTVRIERLLANLSVAFGLVALLLAGVGLYGVIAYIAAQREHEIGIRMALGATRLDVVGHVVRDTAVLVIAGMAAGLLAAAMTSRTVASLLFGLQASDAWSYALALVVLMIIGLAASVLPAWRAARTSPMQALRQ